MMRNAGMPADAAERGMILKVSAAQSVVRFRTLRLRTAAPHKPKVEQPQNWRAPKGRSASRQEESMASA